MILPFYNGRNKTFFFGSYEGFRRAQPSTRACVLQCAHTAELSGDFSALLQGPNPIQLYNPFTTRSDPANPGSFIRDPFPNNDISSVLNPGAVTLAKAVFPAPQPVVNGFNGYDLSSNLTPQNQYSFRVDHNFNPSNSVFFRYTNSDQTQGRNRWDRWGDRYGRNVRKAIRVVLLPPVQPVNNPGCAIRTCGPHE